MHRLVRPLFGVALACEDALHPENVSPLLPQQVIHPDRECAHVYLTRHIDSQTRDRLVMLVLGVGVEELRVHLERAVQVESLQVQHVLGGDAGLRRPNDRGESVHRSQPRLDPFEILLLGHQIDLVENEAIGERHLFDALVLRALRLLLVQVLLDVVRVHQCDDAIKLEELLHEIVNEEGLRYGGRIRHARGLDHDRIELEPLLLPLSELLESLDEVIAHGAADAAVQHLDHLLLGVLFHVLAQQRVVDANLAKLVLDARDAPAMLCR
mmetsp:Transcript_73987/g.211274  ORF Transcript_73987/g.211274 Transcript_73987/m.211274 type:complete len:268 (-) Transcript_73987:13-816(-)